MLLIKMADYHVLDKNKGNMIYNQQLNFLQPLNKKNYL